jgi:hypothetical protein
VRDEEILEVDGEEGCTALRIHLKPLNQMLQNGQNAVLCYVCLTTKRGGSRHWAKSDISSSIAFYASWCHLA